MASSGWGWQNSRPPTKTPAEWSARFRTARAALQNGRLLPPAALLPAAALLHECSLLQLLTALPQTMEALVLSGRAPQTAAEFENEQLKTLDAARKRVLAVLYPGLATVLRGIVAPPPLTAAAAATTAAATAVGQHSTASNTTTGKSMLAGATSAVTSEQQCSDAHVRRLAAKVNIMAACTLRGLVEGAITALHTYFSLYAANTRAVADTAERARAAAAATAAAAAASAAASAAQSLRKGSRLRQQRLQQQPQRGVSPLHSGTANKQNKQYRNSFMPGSSEAAGDLPPAFVAVLVLETSSNSTSSSSSSRLKLGCSASCAAHAAAVQRVVRAVFACFRRVPRVTYSTAYSAAPDADLLLLASITSNTTGGITGNNTTVDEDIGAGVWGLLGLTPTTVSSTAAPTVVPTVVDPNVDGTSPPPLEELMADVSADVFSDVASSSDVTSGSKNAYLPVAQPSERKLAAQLSEIAQLLQANAAIAAASTAAFGPYEYLLREQRAANATSATATSATAAAAPLVAGVMLDSVDKDLSHTALDALSQVRTYTRT
jgi:hypothetical protein